MIRPSSTAFSGIETTDTNTDTNGIHVSGGNIGM